MRILLWHGYLLAMCGATGCGIAEMTSWLDRHAENTVGAASPVEIRR